MRTTFIVEIDWDQDGTWTDETSRVRRVQIKSGFERPGDAVAAVGRCTLTLDNHDRRFSPGDASSPLGDRLRPRREVRVRASDGTSVWTLFRGLIDSIQPDAGAWGGGVCRISCSDALALLANQRVGVPHEDTKAAHEAVSEVVSAAYAPPAAVYANNGDRLTHYGRTWTPETTTCRDALREICDALHGRFYIARDGTAVYLGRETGQNSSISPSILLGDVAYWQRVKEVRRANLLAYWRLDELAGAAAADSSDHDCDALTSNITWGAGGIGDGSSAAHLDGIHGWIDLFTNSLHAAFYGEAGTLLLWVRARAASVWSDGTARTLARLFANSNNEIVLRKDADNQLVWLYRAGGTSQIITRGDMATDGWQCLALTWDRAADEVRAYLAGELQGSAQSGLGRWSGVLDPARMILGANSTAGGAHWDGDLAHAALWNAALTPGEITMLAGV